MQSKASFRDKLITRCSNNTQYVNEDVDDIKVEVQGSKNVLLRRDAVLVFSTHHHLSIIDEIKREEKSSTRCISNVGGLARYEGNHNAKDKQKNDSNK